MASLVAVLFCACNYKRVCPFVSGYVFVYVCGVQTCNYSRAPVRGWHIRVYIIQQMGFCAIVAVPDIIADEDIAAGRRND